LTPSILTEAFFAVGRDERFSVVAGEPSKVPLEIKKMFPLSFRY